MVDLVIQVIYDVWNFLFFLIVWLGLTTALYKVSGFTLGSDDFESVDSNLVLFIQMFRNSIGDV